MPSATNMNSPGPTETQLNDEPVVFRSLVPHMTSDSPEILTMNPSLRYDNLDILGPQRICITQEKSILLNTRILPTLFVIASLFYT